jgi:hypothetical protein
MLLTMQNLLHKGREILDVAYVLAGTGELVNKKQCLCNIVTHDAFVVLKIISVYCTYYKPVARFSIIPY